MRVANMTAVHEEFSRRLADLDGAITEVFDGQSSDERAVVLRDLLFAQARVCEFHFRLLNLESSGRAFLSEEAVCQLLEREPGLVELFQEFRSEGDKSYYELESIRSFYYFIRKHIEDEEP